MTSYPIPEGSTWKRDRTQEREEPVQDQTKRNRRSNIKPQAIPQREVLYALSSPDLVHKGWDVSRFVFKAQGREFRVAFTVLRTMLKAGWIDSSPAWSELLKFEQKQWPFSIDGEQRKFVLTEKGWDAVGRSICPDGGDVAGPRPAG